MIASTDRKDSFFSPLRKNRNLARLWYGQLLSRLGSSISYVALLLLVRKFTGSNLATAIVGICEAVPGIIAGPIAGAIVDRYNRRKIMIYADLARALVMAIVVFLFIFEHLETWHLYVLAAISSIGTAFFDPAQMAIVPELVSEEEIDRANALLKTTYQIGGLAGPSFGAILYTSLGPSSCFILDSLSFFVSGFFIWTMTDTPSLSPAHSRESILKELKEGFALMIKEPVIAGILMSCLIVNFAFFPLPVLLPEIAEKAYQSSRTLLSNFLGAWSGLPSGAPLLTRLSSAEFFFGALMTFLMLGQISASLTVRFFEKIRGVRLFIYYSLIIIALSISAIGFFPMATVGLLAVFLIGYSSTITEIRLTGFIQTTFPQEMLGRIFAMILTIAFAMTPISMSFCGVLADWYGASSVLAWLGLVLLAASSILIMSGILQAEKRLLAQK